jgi:hypothetical protein
MAGLRPLVQHKQRDEQAEKQEAAESSEDKRNSRTLDDRGCDSVLHGAPSQCNRNLARMTRRGAPD